MAIAYVKHKVGTATATGSMTVTLDSATTNGNYLIAFWGAVGSGQAQSVSGFTELVDQACNTSETGSWIYMGWRTITSGQNSVTFTGTSATAEDSYGGLIEVSGSSLAYRGGAAYDPSGTGTTMVLPDQTAKIGDIVIGCGIFHDDDSTAFSWGNSFTGIGYAEAAVNTPQIAGGMGYRVVSADGTYGSTVTATSAASDQRHGIIGVWYENITPTITDVETTETFRDGDTNVTITGTNMGATQGTGVVEIGNASTYGASTIIVGQTVTSWGNTTTNFTAVIGGLTPGTNYLYVTHNNGNRSTGFAITINRAKKFVLTASANITASGANTTAQLTAPSGKTSGSDFGGGRIQDDENPTDTVNIGLSDYREDEWCIATTANVVVDEIYEFRVIINGANSTTLKPVTPTWTIGTITYELSHFRWRNDDGSETTATWRITEDTNMQDEDETTKRLRVQINATGDPASQTYTIQYKKSTDDDWRTIH